MADVTESAGDPTQLSHVDTAGRAHMVDVGAKDTTSRTAVAEGRVLMQGETLRQIRENRLKKGDVLATAQIAGVMAAKRTHELVPLCHPLPITYIDLELDTDETGPAGFGGSVSIRATVRCDGKTGVEMEALTAVSVAALTVYDMAKAI
ncbi:MAG TPA: cyclic pyranopterin monophosphate synthase MoaC, partial [Dehalococcoidia bacterium]|nr:cyclic pyranopterin monophosphate synthase MoaC [Dehalococcoidia bacterium]